MAKLPAPSLLTFDIFGTVLDWRRGLGASLARSSIALTAPDFDRIVDAQGRLERAPSFRSYRDITAKSLVEILGLDADTADAIGEEVGRWPLFDDAREAMRRLEACAPCVAMTNSDRAHGEDVRRSLGFELSGWLAAEDTRVYKPSPAFWHAVARTRGVEPSASWWHVSAYADYDLDVARSLGLTTVLVRRAHARPGPADLEVANLLELASVVEALSPSRRAPAG
jgi:2-haloalkanoic acid dehalogenase type II